MVWSSSQIMCLIAEIRLGMFLARPKFKWSISYANTRDKVSNVSKLTKTQTLKRFSVNKLTVSGKVPPGKFPPRKFPPGIFPPMFLNIPTRVFKFFVFSFLSLSSLIFLKILFSNSVLKVLRSEIQKSMYQKNCSLPVQV